VKTREVVEEDEAGKRDVWVRWVDGRPGESGRGNEVDVELLGEWQKPHLLTLSKRIDYIC